MSPDVISLYFWLPLLDEGWSVGDVVELHAWALYLSRTPAQRASRWLCNALAILFGP